MAWFAFYVLRGHGSGSRDTGASAKSRYGHLGSLGPSLTGSMLKAKPWALPLCSIDSASVPRDTEHCAISPQEDGLVPSHQLLPLMMTVTKLYQMFCWMGIVAW